MKKGFTLVELLTVIVIIGLIGMIAYPVIINILNDSNSKAYDAQIRLVEKAAKQWGVENVVSLPSNCGESKDVSLSNLISGGYINGTVIGGSEVIENPKKRGKGLSGKVTVTYDCTNSPKYIYKYVNVND